MIIAGLLVSRRHARAQRHAQRAQQRLNIRHVAGDVIHGRGDLGREPTDGVRSLLAHPLGAEDRDGIGRGAHRMAQDLQDLQFVSEDNALLAQGTQSGS